MAVRPTRSFVRALICAIALTGCVGAVDRAISVAREYEHLRLEGDLYELSELLADEDVPLFADGYRAELYRGLRYDRRGIAGARVDSIAVLSSNEDTVLLAVHISEPDWTHPQWKPWMHGVAPASSLEERTRMVDSVAPYLPARNGVDRLTLVSEDSEWRVLLSLRRREPINEAARRMLGRRPDSRSLRQRAGEARAFLAIARDSVGLAATRDIAEAAAVLVQAAYLDSVDILRARIADARALVDLRNRSNRDLRAVYVTLVDSAGVAATISEWGIKPRSRFRIEDDSPDPPVESVARAYISGIRLSAPVRERDSSPP